MTEEEGRREIVFQMTMSAVWKMFEEGLITREQYVSFDTIMREKNSPVFGGLFSDINLK